MGIQPGYLWSMIGHVQNGYKHKADKRLYQKTPLAQPQVVTTDNTLLNMKKIHRVREKGGRKEHRGKRRSRMINDKSSSHRSIAP